LPSWGLPHPSGDDITHNHFKNRRGINAGAGNGRFHGGRPQLYGWHTAQTAIKFTDRGSCRTDNDNIGTAVSIYTHVKLLSGLVWNLTLLYAE
jgi:hypothetical protein